jgi:two-component system, sensor histidine kinase and response regulator
MTPNGRPILVVEDSVLQRTVLRRTLVEAGYDVIETGDGVEAIEALTIRQVDLIISDVEMPEMDGYTLCQEVRRNERFADIPVMLLTAMTSPRDLVRGIMAEADTYITKPYEPEALLRRVATLLGMKHQRPEKGSTRTVSFAGESYEVPADPQYTLNFLLATYENVAAQNHELDQLNQQKNQFLGMAAHDMRNPLFVIEQFSAILTEGMIGDLSEEQAQLIDRIRANSEFMLRLVDELLDITKIESGTLQLNAKPTDLVDVIERNLGLNRVVAEAKDIALRFEPPAALPLIEVDESKLEQVLNNLISNAVKYSHNGTRVDVMLARGDGTVRLSVKDEGQGIPADEQAELFEPFHQTSVKSTEGEKSTGLGLAISKRIVVGHRGRIWVESEEGVGSTFHVELPAP